MKSYYYKHHNKLDKVVSNILKKYQKCIIIDLHNFSDDMVKKLLNINDNPDICIGVDNLSTDETLIDFTINHFKKCGYST